MEPEPVAIDAAEGAVGGHSLRTALALCAITGRRLELLRFRAGAPKPGLEARHIACARAAAAISGATVEGVEMRSTRLLFAPGAVRAGEYEFDLGGEGAVAHLLDVLVCPLALAGQPSRLSLRGPTHVEGAPSFHELALGLCPALGRVGFGVQLRLVAAGFGAGAPGQITAAVEPVGPTRTFDLRRRGTLTGVHVIPVIAGSGAGETGSRLARTASRALRALGVASEPEVLPLPAGPSPGFGIVLQAAYERVELAFGAIGVDGKPAEAVARDAVARFADHHSSGMALDEHVATQLLLPLALGSAGRMPGPTPIHRFTVARLNRNLFRAAAVIRRFLPVDITIFGREGDPGDVRVAPPGLGEILRLGREPP